MPIFILFILFSFSLQSATFNYSVDNEKSKMKIAGTSFLHDWETKVEKLSGEGFFEIKKDNVSDIKSFYLKVDPVSIKSGNDGIDEKTHNALKAQTYPVIRATIKNIKKLESGAKVEGIVDIFVGGVTQSVPFLADLKKAGDHSLVIEGEKKLSMKSFQIDPPSVWFFKAGDEVDVSFSLFLKVKVGQGK
jgi:YceI-like domain